MLTIHCIPVSTICCHRAVLAVCIAASFRHPTPGSFIVPQPDRPPRRPTSIFIVPPHVFVFKWPHPWRRRPRGLNYTGKMHRQHIKQLNIHTQHLPLMFLFLFLSYTQHIKQLNIHTQHLPLLFLFLSYMHQPPPTTRHKRQSALRTYSP